MKTNKITQSLSLSPWTVKQVGTSKTYPATVPGEVHTDLMTAGGIPDPFFRDNENRLQWIGEVDWVYESSFSVSAALLKKERVLLRCEGLDTLARVRVNGKDVGTADNMFRIWEFDVREALKTGKNRISVTFASADAYIARKHQELDLRSGHSTDSRGHLRKQPCNFGWDWGIRVVTCGIWRPIALVAFDTARLSDVRIAQDHSRKGEVGLTVDTGAERTGRSRLTAKVTVQLGGQTVAAGEAAFGSKRNAQELLVENPQLWWPNNLGDQPLYTVTVELYDAAGVLLDTWSKRIGLRTLKLGLHGDAWGESFQFEVNGVPFFAKGANWVPADAFLSRNTPERYRERVQAAADVNMNMLRVWGGGIYEDEAFYDACDELGICVWQDFMFAGTAYPTPDKAFMETVKAEAEDAVKTLRHHPCLALWCGNNEIESNKYYHKNQTLRAWADYIPLFDRLLPKAVKAFDPGRDYWPSSPHKTITDRNKTAEPSNGNVHFWRVWHGRSPFEFYRERTPRFITEYGFQSFPHPRTVESFTEPEDRNITSRIMEHHQRSGTGNTLILQYMLDWFRMPSGFENTVWASQILQGIAMQIGTEHWRRAMPCTMGTLYWQFNDNWPVASWSSIDYHGRWKALQYFAKRFYAPLLVSGVEDAAAGTVEVHVTSDLLNAVDARVEWTVKDTDGTELLTGGKSVRAGAGASRRVATLRLKKLLEAQGPNRVLVWLKLTAPGQPDSENLVMFARPKHLELSPTPGIRASVRNRKDGTFSVRLSSRKPAMWVWLDVEGVDARLSDNFFHLRPGEPVTVDLTPKPELTLAQLTGALRVRSLVDTCREMMNG